MVQFFKTGKFIIVDLFIGVYFGPAIGISGRFHNFKVLIMPLIFLKFVDVTFQ